MLYCTITTDKKGSTDLLLLLSDDLRPAIIVKYIFKYPLFYYQTYIVWKCTDFNIFECKK